MAAKIGAPKKYDEKMHPVCYNFPVSLIAALHAALQDASSRTEVPQSILIRRFVHDGLANMLTKQPA
jgi:hypothetical protein